MNNENFNIDNEPRLKGRSLTSKGNLTEISKGVFTTCKIRDGCPPWEISAEKIQHDSEKRIINYKNAWLKIYDVPVMYFPKFFIQIQLSKEDLVFWFLQLKIQQIQIII